MSWREAISNLDDTFLRCAFDQGRQCRLVKDGHYCPSIDRDLILMYCMGEQI